MRQARRRPPSRARYAAKHPTIGVHTTVEVRDRLLALRDSSGHSFAQLILAALGQVELDVTTARDRGRKEGFGQGFAAGWDNGFAAAEAQFRVSYDCAVCGEDVALSVGASDTLVATEVMTRGGFGHQSCHEKVSYRPLGARS